MSTLEQQCPQCGITVTMTPYDIGSGPEMSCPECEWCWGAEGQPLKDLPKIDAAMIEHMMRTQVEPQVAAQKMRERGMDVDTAFVNTDPSATGHQVACVRCGRTAMLPMAPPQGAIVMCPSCLRETQK